MSEQLALLGGQPTIRHDFQPYNPYGGEEAEAARLVIEGGALSCFLGTWSDGFYGGPHVQAFERAWEKAFDIPHAVAVNSATSGLIAAVGALEVEPGAEVIVSPWTMSATAAAILVWNGIPVFADIEPETFGMDPEAIERRITPRTQAIVVTDIFGHAARLGEIMDIAARHGLKVVEDAAQAPAAVCERGLVGTVADIGVYSLNYHKHIHTGEGGVCVTRDPALAERMQLIRNHAEAVVADKHVSSLANLIGFNFRLGEIEAAMGREQLRKLKGLAATRTRVGTALTAHLGNLEGLRVPVVRPGCTHVYYVYGVVLDRSVVEIPRERILDALRAEGVPAAHAGYTNIHLLPIFQQRIAYGRHGFPWSGGFYEGEVSYERGTCPVAEALHARTLIALHTCLHRFSDEEVDLVGHAFRKVWNQLEQLR